MFVTRIVSTTVLSLICGLTSVAQAAPYYSRDVKIQIANVLGLGNADVRHVKFSSQREIRYTMADGGRIAELRRGTYTYQGKRGVLAVTLFRDGGVQVTSPSRRASAP